jgi:hypothetical protein
MWQQFHAGQVTRPARKHAEAIMLAGRRYFITKDFIPAALAPPIHLNQSVKA